MSEVVPRQELDFRHEDARLTEDVRVQAVISLLEGKTLRIQGTCRAELEFQCCRCLEHFSQGKNLDFDLLYIPQPGSQESTREIELRYEDMEVGFYDGVAFETNLAISEQILLALPMKSLCREDCHGLCPQCGKNQNREECQCQPAASNPFREKLQGLRETLERKS